jgi:hypothetical protein
MEEERGRKEGKEGGERRGDKARHDERRADKMKGEVR